ncbi:MAG: CHRD domain-containing protein [Acidimicrobiales bacterium]
MARRWRPLVGVLVAASLAAIAASGVASAGQVVKLDAHMDGASELPPADPDGDGRAKFEFDLDTGEVCFSVRFDDIGTPNRAHIHVGGPEVNGAIVLPMFELRPGDAPASDPRHDELEGGRLGDCVTADPDLLADIAADPGGYYVNLHNTRFPGGAIRGQLEG